MNQELDATGWWPTALHPDIVDVPNTHSRRRRSGTATAVQPGSKGIGFRLESFDGSGNRRGVIPVQCRGRHRHLKDGDRVSLRDGDRVEVAGRAKKGVIRARWVRNFTTGDYVGNRPYQAFRKRLAVAAIVVVLGAAAGIIVSRHHRPSSESSGTSSASVPAAVGPFPVLADVQVRSGPQIASQPTGTYLKASVLLMVACQENGDNVPQPHDSAVTENLWDRIDNPAGYVPDAYVRTGSNIRVAATCQ